MSIAEGLREAAKLCRAVAHKSREMAATETNTKFRKDMYFEALCADDLARRINEVAALHESPPHGTVWVVDGETGDGYWTRTEPDPNPAAKRDKRGEE